MWPIRVSLQNEVTFFSSCQHQLDTFSLYKLLVVSKKKGASVSGKLKTSRDVSNLWSRNNWKNRGKAIVAGLYDLSGFRFKTKWHFPPNCQQQLDTFSLSNCLVVSEKGKEKICFFSRDFEFEGLYTVLTRFWSLGEAFMRRKTIRESYSHSGGNVKKETKGTIYMCVYIYIYTYIYSIYIYIYIYREREI